MNNSGKSSVIFLILIPLFFASSLIIMDTLFSYTQNKNLEVVTEEVIKEVVEDENIKVDEYAEEIKKAYERRGIDTDMLVVDANDYEIMIENEHRYFGIFSSLRQTTQLESEIKIFGVTFKAKKNSVARISVEAKFDENDKLIFEYTK